MNKLQEATQSNVWQHWMCVENSSNMDFRSDIRDPLPEDLTWYLAEIEEVNLDKLFVISSCDWMDISGGTFRVLDVVKRLDIRSDHPDTQRITNDIRKKMTFLESGGKLNTRLITVTNYSDLRGPFTLIEGNRRAITFCLRNEIVGCQIFVGISPDIINYKWARKSFYN